MITETVYESQAPDAAIMNTAEDITINGKDGKYLAFENMKILRWKIGDVELSLTAPWKKMNC